MKLLFLISLFAIVALGCESKSPEARSEEPVSEQPSSIETEEPKKPPIKIDPCPSEWGHYQTDEAKWGDVIEAVSDFNASRPDLTATSLFIKTDGDLPIVTQRHKHKHTDKIQWELLDVAKSAGEWTVIGVNSYCDAN